MVFLMNSYFEDQATFIRLDCFKGEHPERESRMLYKIKNYLENHRDPDKEGEPP